MATALPLVTSWTVDLRIRQTGAWRERGAARAWDEVQSPWMDRASVCWQRHVGATDSSMEKSLEGGCSATAGPNGGDWQQASLEGSGVAPTAKRRATGVEWGSRGDVEVGFAGWSVIIGTGPDGLELALKTVDVA